VDLLLTIIEIVSPVFLLGLIGFIWVKLGIEYNVEFVPKVRLEIVVEDERAERVVEAVAQASHTGKIGDGKIFVYNIDQAVRIRTGETGNDAL